MSDRLDASKYCPCCKRNTLRTYGTGSYGDDEEDQGWGNVLFCDAQDCSWNEVDRRCSTKHRYSDAHIDA